MQQIMCSLKLQKAFNQQQISTPDAITPIARTLTQRCSTGFHSVSYHSACIVLNVYSMAEADLLFYNV